VVRFADEAHEGKISFETYMSAFDLTADMVVDDSNAKEAPAQRWGCDNCTYINFHSDKVGVWGGGGGSVCVMMAGFGTCTLKPTI
jgi:hypothetical protein